MLREDHKQSMNNLDYHSSFKQLDDFQESGGSGYCTDAQVLKEDVMDSTDVPQVRELIPISGETSGISSASSNADQQLIGGAIDQITNIVTQSVEKKRSIKSAALCAFKHGRLPITPKARIYFRK